MELAVTEWFAQIDLDRSWPSFTAPVRRVTVWLRGQRSDKENCHALSSRYEQRLNVGGFQRRVRLAALFDTKNTDNWVVGVEGCLECPRKRLSFVGSESHFTWAPAPASPSL